MAVAYAVADGGPLSLSKELHAISYIDRFGVEAVYGRSLTNKEIVSMRIAENVNNAYEQ